MAFRICRKLEPLAEKGSTHWARQGTEIKTKTNGSDDKSGDFNSVLVRQTPQTSASSCYRSWRRSMKSGWTWSCGSTTLKKLNEKSSFVLGDHMISCHRRLLRSMTGRCESHIDSSTLFKCIHIWFGLTGQINTTCTLHSLLKEPNALFSRTTPPPPHMCIQIPPVY